jgi:hypothetical protein
MLENHCVRRVLVRMRMDSFNVSNICVCQIQFLSWAGHIHILFFDLGRCSRE